MMTSNVLSKAEQLAEKIRLEPVETRLGLRPEFARLLSALRIEGTSIPRRLQHLENELTQEEAERQFDNLPV